MSIGLSSPHLWWNASGRVQHAAYNEGRLLI